MGLQNQNKSFGFCLNYDGKSFWGLSRRLKMSDLNFEGASLDIITYRSRGFYYTETSN